MYNNLHVNELKCFYVFYVLTALCCLHATIHPPTTIYINEDKIVPNTDNFMIFTILYFYSFILV